MFVIVEDWGCEYLDMDIVVKVVDDVDGVIVYINIFSFSYIDCVIIED